MPQPVSTLAITLRRDDLGRTDLACLRALAAVLSSQRMSILLSSSEVGVTGRGPPSVGVVGRRRIPVVTAPLTDFHAAGIGDFLTSVTGSGTMIAPVLFPAITRREEAGNETPFHCANVNAGQLNSSLVESVCEQKSDCFWAGRKSVSNSNL